MIRSFKHNGKIHRTWENSILLAEGDMMICANDHVKVTEADGREWFSKEPAICFFPRRDWFNMIAMIREDGIYFYCNLSSPPKWNEGILSYVDYDLDVMVYPNWNYDVLDESEFEENRERMGYSLRTVTRIRSSLHHLLSELKIRKTPFQHPYVIQWYEKYCGLTEKPAQPNFRPPLEE